MYIQKKLLIVFFFSVFSLGLGLLLASCEKNSFGEMKLWYTHPATHWMTSALPIGNGELGALFFGGIACEQIQFNEKTLWTGSSVMRGAYQSFGNIYINFEGIDTCTIDKYHRELSLDDGTGRVRFCQNGVDYHREYFASNPDSMIVIRIYTLRNKGKLNFTVSLKDRHEGVTTVKDGTILLIQNHLDLLSYEAQLKVLNEGGDVLTDSSQIKVKGADAVTLLLTGATNFNISSPNYIGETEEQLHARLSNRIQMGVKKGYEELRERHLADYCPLFGRVKFDLGESLPTIPTDELVRKHKESLYLDMLYFQYGRYLMLASSRGMNLPNNLQGIWNADNTPPWECDIHNNINIQMNYWPAETANLPECHLPFLEYIAEEAIGRPEGRWRKIAQEEGLRGWAVNTQNNIFGYSDWNINRPANAWYCMHLWQHFVYSNDLEYLQKTAFPVMKSACEYWFDRLKVDNNGRLIAPDEWSPEQGCWEDGVSYAQQLIWQLFSGTMQAIELLRSENINVEDIFVSELTDKFQKLDNGLEIGSWGQIKEWKEDKEKLDFQGNDHRHLSQLIALYPGNQISYHRDSLFADAAKKTLLSRGDMGTGWSRAWKIACWARLFDGDHAYRLLKSALSLSTLTVVSMNNFDGGIYENLFDSHPPFQIDGNFGATAGIVEMLLQSHRNYIHLLPALPLAWSNGSVEGLRAEGNFTIGLKWHNGHLMECSVISGSGGECRIYYPDIRKMKIRDDKGREVSVSFITNEQILFPTKKGENYIIEAI